MGLQFFGIDPETEKDGSPTVWANLVQRRLIIQSYTLAGAELTEVSETEWAAGHRTGVPGHESVISIPESMIPFIRKACDAIERAGLRDAAQADDEVGRPSGDA